VTLRRFFIKTSLSKEMFIDGQDAHHISKVLRLQVGDKIIVIPPDGQAGTAQIIEIAVDRVRLLLERTLEEAKEAPIQVYLAQGLPKSDKMDYIIQKAVELGVTAIFPIQMDHSVVQYDHAKKKSRGERWQKISLEAAKQCGRSFIPSVEPIQSLTELFSRLLDEVVIIMLYEGQTEKGLKKALAEKTAKNYLLLVGPEGGFSNQELIISQKHGALVVTMGPRILRTETASLAAVAMIMYEYGDMGG